MPRKSYRQQALDYMRSKVDNLLLSYHMREAMDEDDSSADDELIKQSEILDQMSNNRYLFRSPKYRKKKDRHHFDMDDALSYESKKYNEDEFLFTFRISRDSFFLFLEEMKSKQAFIVKGKSSHQRPIAYQLLVFLYRIGKEGSA